MNSAQIQVQGLAELERWCASRVPGREARLRRFGALLARLGADPEWRTPPLVKLAGTNGKGSVGALLEAVLRADGRRVGLFTSPHLARFTERVRVDGEEVSAARLDAAVARVWPRLAQLERELGPDHRVSLFEALIVASLALFAEEGVELALVEAGVGGSNDPTSLLAAPLAAITSVALDHTDELGDTLERIAADKAGIASAGSTLVLGPTIDAGCRAVIRAECTRRDVLVREARLERVELVAGDLRGSDVRLRGRLELEPLRLPLAGAHQLANLATALELAEALHERGRLARIESLAGVANARWAGRMELVEGRPAWLFDAAHNQEGAAALAESARTLFAGRRALLLCGAGEPGKAPAILRRLIELTPSVHLVEGAHRALALRGLERCLPPEAVVIGRHASPQAAVDAILRAHAGEDLVVVVAGSLYTMAAVREALFARSRREGAA